jgi:hypothetical protein
MYYSARSTLAEPMVQRPSPGSVSGEGRCAQAAFFQRTNIHIRNVEYGSYGIYQ